MKKIPESDMEKQIKAHGDSAERWLSLGATFCLVAFVALFKLADPAYAYGLALSIYWMLSVRSMGELRVIACKLEHLQEMGIRRELEGRRE